ncbi:hypothetical protein J6590_015765 [Homalodisca vitripennis]|nr:hypothetical protein J6590_015765 [Homalodisca vitripennis]
MELLQAQSAAMVLECLGTDQSPGDMAVVKYRGVPESRPDHKQVHVNVHCPVYCPFIRLWLLFPGFPAIFLQTLMRVSGLFVI